MNLRVELIVEETRKLTEAERAELFERLATEFDGEPADGTPEEIEAAWLEEVERRASRADRGEATLIDHAESMAKLRARLAARRGLA
ncbi:MAG: addiction module protein [Hyphomicrobium aestuarii]|nr:addiction module protein [Hyphomicrobium aestuarii]